MPGASGEILCYIEGGNKTTCTATVVDSILTKTRKEVHQLFNPFLEQRLAEERVKDAMRKAERARLIWAARGAGMADRAALHSLLIKVRDLGLRLISVNRIEPDVEEVLGQLN